MKTYTLIALSTLVLGAVQAQTNTFPTTGNVGVGTTSPAVKLQVATDGVSTPTALLPGSTAVVATASTTVGSSLITATSATGGIRAVYGVVRARGSLASPTAVAASDTLGAYGFFGYDGSAVQLPALIESYVDGAVTAGNVPTRIGLITGSNGTNRLERLTVASSGNVGIGTTSPAAKLHIYQTTNGTLREVLIKGTISDASNDTFYVGNGTTQTGTFHPVVGGYVTTTNASPSIEVMGMVSAANDTSDSYTSGVVRFQAFRTSNDTDPLNGTFSNIQYRKLFSFSGVSSTGADEYLTIAAGGNVGIGTTTPTQKLAVNGTIRAKEVIVDTGWSDYVFAADYKLAPLAEVESQIKAHGHLPGIPSAQDVAEHGVSMGEMQSKLLAKIEELTLHQIEQEKRLSLQDQEIQQLLKQNKALCAQAGISSTP